MNEFSLIERFFKQPALPREDVIFGIGDDAACLQLGAGLQLLVSTDTLVENVHFLNTWDAFDIAWKAVMVNISDMAAMAAQPNWISLALTLPKYDEPWLQRFSDGLHQALAAYHISLIGGDTTHGPLGMTLTIHGTVPANSAVRRFGAKAGDIIWVSGELGAAALAVLHLQDNQLDKADFEILLDKLKRPVPRLDFLPLLREYASAAIDISDGLSADLNHICKAGQTGACLTEENIPVHVLVKKYQKQNALDLALSGGDDYELCFTIPSLQNDAFKDALAKAGLNAQAIGVMEEKEGLRLLKKEGVLVNLAPCGYSHF